MNRRHSTNSCFALCLDGQVFDVSNLVLARKDGPGSPYGAAAPALMTHVRARVGALSQNGSTPGRRRVPRNRRRSLYPLSSQLSLMETPELGETDWGNTRPQKTEATASDLQYPPESIEEFHHEAASAPNETTTSNTGIYEHLLELHASLAAYRLRVRATAAAAVGTNTGTATTSQNRPVTTFATGVPPSSPSSPPNTATESLPNVAPAASNEANEPGNPMIEVGPGSYAPYYGASHTLDALHKNEHQITKCISCQCFLACVWGIQYVICPSCHVVSMVDYGNRRSSLEFEPYGAGIGLRRDARRVSNSTARNPNRRQTVC
ncbi:expressed unknown protein [Seminavis robusta]|uniref:Uncharacterized protein n=1 Tax=Seminavis robusta TaxID=568900 RepID=A0A9N8E106_9STRA|nr:expressed unknown protein [Seminavis robusta]|eukprot:Sro540_g162930.1 n/a (321) ;mRNA; f:9712-10674